MNEKVIEADFQQTSEEAAELNAPGIMIDSITPGKITWNYDELKNYLNVVTDKYKNVVVSAETKSDATATKNKLSAMKTELDNQRKYVKRKMSEPVNDTDGKFKALIDILDGAYTNIVSQLKELDKKEKEAKLAKVNEWIEQVKKAATAKGMTQAYLDQFVFDEKWLNKTATEKSIKTSMVNQINELFRKQKDEETIIESIKESVASANEQNGLTSKLNAKRYLELLKFGKELPEILKQITEDAANQRRAEEMLKQKAEQDALKKAAQMSALDFMQPSVEIVDTKSDEEESVVHPVHDCDYDAVDEFMQSTEHPLCYVYAFAGTMEQMKALGEAFKTLQLEFKPIKAYKDKIQMFPKKNQEVD